MFRTPFSARRFVDQTELDHPNPARRRLAVDTLSQDENPQQTIETLATVYHNDPDPQVRSVAHKRITQICEQVGVQPSLQQPDTWDCSYCGTKHIESQICPTCDASR